MSTALSRPAPGGVDVHVDNNGQLFVAAPTGGSVNAHDLIVVQWRHPGSHHDPDQHLIGHAGRCWPAPTASPIPMSRCPTPRSACSLAALFPPAPPRRRPQSDRQVITLIRAPTVINDTTLAQQNASLSQNIPFLFESQTDTAGNSAGVPDPLSFNAAHTDLLLTLLPRSTGATNADGTPGLNLSGDAKALFPFAAAALANDPELGAAIGTNLTRLQDQRRALERHQCRRQPAEGPAGLLAVDPRCFGRHPPGRDPDHRPGHRPGRGAPAAAALLCRSAGRTHALGRGIRRQHQQQGTQRRQRHA